MWRDPSSISLLIKKKKRKRHVPLEKRWGEEVSARGIEGGKKKTVFLLSGGGEKNVTPPRGEKGTHRVSKRQHFDTSHEKWKNLKPV